MQKKRNQSINLPIAVGGMNNVLPPDRIGETQATQLINVSYVNDKFQGSKKFKLSDSRLFKYLYSVKTVKGFKLYATGETVLYNITDNISYDMEDVIVDMISNVDGVYCATKQALVHIDNDGIITKQLFYICNAEPYYFVCGGGFNTRGAPNLAVAPAYYHEQQVNTIWCISGFNNNFKGKKPHNPPTFFLKRCDAEAIDFLVDVFQLNNNYYTPTASNKGDSFTYYQCYTYYSFISYDNSLSAVMRLDKKSATGDEYECGNPPDRPRKCINTIYGTINQQYYSVISYANNTKYYTYPIPVHAYPFCIFEKHNDIFLALEQVIINNKCYLNLWKYREGDKRHTSHRIDYNGVIEPPFSDIVNVLNYAKIIYDKKLKKYILLLSNVDKQTTKTINYIVELDIERCMCFNLDFVIKKSYEFDKNYCIIDYFYSKNFGQYLFVTVSVASEYQGYTPYKIYYSSNVELLINFIQPTQNFNYLHDRRVLFPDNWDTNPDFPCIFQFNGNNPGYRIGLEDTDRLFKGEIKCLLYQNDRLVVGQGSELTYSAVGDFHDWDIEKSEKEQNPSGAKFLEVGYKDTGHISHGFVIYDNIILFKDNGKIFRVAGFLDTWHVSQLGLIKPLTSNIYSYNGALLFGTKDGVKILNTTQAYGDFLVSDFQNNIIDNEVTHISSSQERNTIIFCAKDYVFEYHPTLQIFYVYQKEVYTHMQEYFDGNSYTQYAIGKDGKLYKESDEYNDVEVQRALIHNQYNIVIKAITIYTEPLEEDTELTIELYPNVSFTKVLKQGQSKHKIFQVKRLKELQLKYKHTGKIFITNTVIEISYIGA